MMKPMAAALAVIAAACTSIQADDDDAALKIVGTWRQSDAECGPAQPVRELIFEADGRYSVTWLPFETYRDYWGRYHYDPRAMRLSLTVEGGNYNPPDRALSGEARVADGALTLRGISLGTPQNGIRCSAPFRR
jgi:hypothetical protein